MIIVHLEMWDRERDRGYTGCIIFKSEPSLRSMWWHSQIIMAVQPLINIKVLFEVTGNCRVLQRHNRSEEGPGDVLAIMLIKGCQLLNIERNRQ